MAKRRQSNPKTSVQTGAHKSRVGQSRVQTTKGERDQQRSSGRSQIQSTSRGSGPVPRGTINAEARNATVGGRKGAANQARLRVRGMGLRAKFMLVMAGLTGIGMCVLGFIMAKTADGFLVNQAKHQGIELAKMAAQVGRAVLDSTEASAAGENSSELGSRIRSYLEGARTWGSTQELSFINSIVFEGGDRPGFSGTGVGDEMVGSSSAAPTDPVLTIPGRGSANLGSFQDIEVYKLFKKTARGQVPVYRFKVSIPQRGSPSSYLSSTKVQVDVAIDTLDKVSTRLYIIILIAVVLMIALVVAVANLLAGKITHPVRVLMKDMRIVAQGDLDHRTKPHSSDEVGVLAEEFNLMTQNLKESQAALVEQEKAEYELHIAQEVQQQLLPSQLPEIPGYESASYYKGAKAVSGDYYDFIPFGNGLWGFIVADVSGKGIPGSMVMAVTRTIVRLVAQKHLHNAAETLKETNRLIAKQIKRGMFVTAFYAVLDTNSGTMTLASAGHNPMVIYRHTARKIELAAPKGIAIGFNEGPLFDKNVQQFQVQLSPGDVFAVYTDGFPEAMNEANEEYGDEEFYKRIGVYGAQGAQGVIDGVLKDIAEHRGRAAQSDDLTIITVRRVG
jgi:serine phosphatase RsbU (regulator of sigma subunit)